MACRTLGYAALKPEETPCPVPPGGPSERPPKSCSPEDCCEKHPVAQIPTCGAAFPDASAIARKCEDAELGGPRPGAHECKADPCTATDCCDEPRTCDREPEPYDAAQRKEVHRRGAARPQATAPHGGGRPRGRGEWESWLGVEE